LDDVKGQLTVIRKTPNADAARATHEGGEHFGVRDLARVAKVSVGTVDRALNGRTGISEKTRDRILRLARENGYAPNLSARALSFSRSSLRIGLCIPREIRYFYDQIYAGFTAEAERYRHVGLEVVYRPVKKLSSPAAHAINTLLESKIDALVITPGSAKSMAPLIEKAERERDIRVVCIASDDSPTCRSAAISVDPNVNGSVAAELMAKVVPSGTKVAILTGMLSTEEHKIKVSSFRRTFPVECRGGTVVRIIQGHEEEEEVFEKTLQLLREEQDLGGIYISTVNSIPVCRAVEIEGMAGKIKIIATDLFAELTPYFLNGTLTASIYQNPYRQGQIAVQLIVDHLLRGRPFPHTYYLNPVIALRSNLRMFREMRDTHPQLNPMDHVVIADSY
jgi:LacI family transcriptional regulator